MQIHQSDEERIVNKVSRAELERRWKLARSHLAEAGIHALIVGGSAGPASGYYRWFTGQPAAGGNVKTIILPVDDLMTLIEHGPAGGASPLNGNDPAYAGIARRMTTPSHLFSVCYTAGQDAELVANEIHKRGYTKVGTVGGVGMYSGFHAPLIAALGSVEVVDLTEAIDNVICIKSPEEIDAIRRTAAMQDDIIDKLRQHIRPGLRDFEIAAYAEYLGHLQGSDEGVFLGSSGSPGESAGIRPRAKQGRQLRDGDVFTLLVENNGPGGYYTEIMRTFVLGKPPQQLVDLYGVMVEAQRNTLKHLIPGARPSDILDQHNSFMRSRGLPEERRLHSHSQGYARVERPLVRHDETIEIAANMNFVAHPEFDDGKVFASVCDNYLIGNDGIGDSLHRTPQKIIEL